MQTHSLIAGRHNALEQVFLLLGCLINALLTTSDLVIQGCIALELYVQAKGMLQERVYRWSSVLQHLRVFQGEEVSHEVEKELVLC